MSIQFTEQQKHALDQAGLSLLEVIDPRTQQAYVLVPAEEIESVREIIEDEQRQKAIRAIGLRNAAARMMEAP